MGGALGNARLTSAAGALLIVLLAIEGATVPFIARLLSVHIFVGMLLLGPLTLKLASTSYRLARFYTGGREYVRLGPPVPLLRFLVAPVLVVSTLTLFGTGVALLLVPHRGPLLLAHKASFIVWFGATSIHVLAHVLGSARNVLADLRGRRVPGAGLRFGLTALALLAGVGIAGATYSLATPWLR